MLAGCLILILKCFTWCSVWPYKLFKKISCLSLCNQCFELSISFPCADLPWKTFPIPNANHYPEIGIILILMKIQRWSKLGNGSEVRNGNKKVTINSAGIRQPARLLACCKKPLLCCHGISSLYLFGFTLKT